MDRPPPRHAGDERSVLLSLWRYQRTSFAQKVEGVPDDGARRRFVGSGTTLLWLTQHLADAEQIWICTRFLGRPFFEVRETDDEPLRAALARLERVWSQVDAVVDDTDLDATFVHEDGTTLNLRWVVAHLLEEVARHAGHADILRELLDGSVGR
jgi:uncharacterized damage-inducible protein DinB